MSRVDLNWVNQYFLLWNKKGIILMTTIYNLNIYIVLDFIVVFHESQIGTCNLN